MARITVDDNTGHVMSQEYTIHMNERDEYRNLSSVRDIRTLLLNCSPVTQNQQMKQSFQTFPALPVDETRHLASQDQPVLQEAVSENSDRSGVLAKDVFESPPSSAVSLDNSMTDPWMLATLLWSSRCY